MKPDSEPAVKCLLPVKVFEPAGRFYFCGPASNVSPLDVIRQHVEFPSSRMEG